MINSHRVNKIALFQVPLSKFYSRLSIFFNRAGCMAHDTSVDGY